MAEYKYVSHCGEGRLSAHLAPRDPRLRSSVCVAPQPSAGSVPFGAAPAPAPAGASVANGTLRDEHPCVGRNAARSCAGPAHLAGDFMRSCMRNGGKGAGQGAGRGQGQGPEGRREAPLRHRSRVLLSKRRWADRRET